MSNLSEKTDLSIGFFGTFVCKIWHRKHWTVLRIRTISYRDWIEGRRQETDRYCRRCEREWTT